MDTLSNHTQCQTPSSLSLSHQMEQNWHVDHMTAQSISGPQSAEKLLHPLLDIVLNCTGLSSLLMGIPFVSTYMDLSILIWNVANGHVVGAIELGFSETLTPVSFSPDGKQILIQRGDWEEIAIWDAIHTKDIPSHRWHEEIKKYFQVITDKQWVHNSLDGYLLYFLPVDQVGNWYDNNPWWVYHSAKLVAENKSGMMTIVDATETLHHFGISM